VTGYLAAVDQLVPTTGGPMPLDEHGYFAGPHFPFNQIQNVQILTPGPGDRVVIDHGRQTISGRVTVPDWGPCAAQLARGADREPCIGRGRHGGEHVDRLGRRWGKPDKAAARRERRGVGRRRA
jgi:hypothetical protein